MYSRTTLIKEILRDIPGSQRLLADHRVKCMG
jgi:hypothetical protein